jgi:hypothetical protein
MAGHDVFALGEAIDATIGAHQFFDLGGGRMMGEFEQFCFVRSIGDAGQRANLGKS